MKGVGRFSATPLLRSDFLRLDLPGDHRLVLRQVFAELGDLFADDRAEAEQNSEGQRDSKQHGRNPTDSKTDKRSSHGR